MKRRFVAAGLAAVTTLSVAVVPANAQYNPTSSYSAMYDYYNNLSHKAASRGDYVEAQRIDREWARSSEMRASSVSNDLRNGYRHGTTFDILLGTGIAALLLAGLGGFAVQQGLVKLP